MIERAIIITGRYSDQKLIAIGRLGENCSRAAMSTYLKMLEKASLTLKRSKYPFLRFRILNYNVIITFWQGSKIVINHKEKLGKTRVATPASTKHLLFFLLNKSRDKTVNTSIPSVHGIVMNSALAFQTETNSGKRERYSEDPLGFRESLSQTPSTYQQ